MQADRTEVLWDSGKSKWMVRITVGEEVIRRYCDLPQNTAENDLRTAAQKTLQDEGYETNGAISVELSPHAA
jgi:hypothetical protein